MIPVISMFLNFFLSCFSAALRWVQVDFYAVSRGSVRVFREGVRSTKPPQVCLPLVEGALGGLDQSGSALFPQIETRSTGPYS